MSKQGVRETLRVPGGRVDVAGFDPSGRPVKPDGKKDDLANDVELIASLQERLWAESTAGGTRRVLLVLQGIDTAGKGGVTKHVFAEAGPIGVHYTAFKKPTEEERKHDFLWRVRQRLPGPGEIGIFDRSHYEDVLIVRVHNLVPKEEWSARYELINDFEAELVGDGVTIVKCFLHIGFDTQRDRLLARLDNPDKHWKFNVDDLAERALWSEYQAAFSDMLTRCNTDHAPWYVVPSDDKKYRNWLIGELLCEVLQDLDPQYPNPNLDVPALEKRLAPPN